MDQEREDYADRDLPPPLHIDSPATLLRMFAKTIGMAALCVSVVLALILLASVPVRLLLR